MKVEFTKLNSANVSAENSSDIEKKYDITASVNIQGMDVSSVDAGRVIKNGIEVASFSKWGQATLNINFSVADVTEMCSILTEVNSFYNNVVEKVENEPINI